MTQVSSQENQSKPSARSQTEPSPLRWAWRLAALALFFYLLGYFSNPVTTPLMCKIYG